MLRSPSGDWYIVYHRRPLGETDRNHRVVSIDKLEFDEKKFRWLLNENAMAYEKTGEGIRKFAADVVKLEKFVASKL